MDPNACWKRFLDFCNDGELEEALWAINDLREWTAKGGPPPDGIPDGAIGHLFDWVRHAAERHNEHDMADYEIPAP